MGIVDPKVKVPEKESVKDEFKLASLYVTWCFHAVVVPVKTYMFWSGVWIDAVDRLNKLSGPKP